PRVLAKPWTGMADRRVDVLGPPPSACGTWRWVWALWLLSGEVRPLAAGSRPPRSQTVSTRWAPSADSRTCRAEVGGRSWARPLLGNGRERSVGRRGPLSLTSRPRTLFLSVRRFV